jgi:histidinol dehydrogenase
MTITRNPDRALWPALATRPTIPTADLEARVTPILHDVRERGDAALREYSERFDGVQLDDMRVSDAEFAVAERAVSDDLKASLQLACENIERFHQSQQEPVQRIETRAGVLCWRKSVAIERVGLYIPGGTAPLFSTLLMLGVPSKIAGCPTRILCTPPSQAGMVHPAILYTAQMVGIRDVFKVGGAQAVAAMAFGTQTIPRVDKIFGPGNQYVTVAKQLVQRFGTAIDMPAGPSEVCVLADETCVPAFVAADLLSQAEHGTDSQVLLVTTAESVIPNVLAEIERQLAMLPRRTIAASALANSHVVLFDQMSAAVEFVNEYAAEHLIIATTDADAVAERITQAGSVFIGNYSPEAAGDYASGTNHTLPTNGYARAYSGVSLDSFVKKITFQRLTHEGLQHIGHAVETMAAAEGLDAHKRAVSVRLARE